MVQYFHLHPGNPQPRLVKRAAEMLRDGAVMVYPTDTSYALGCALGYKEAIDRIRDIRRLGNKHYFTLVFPDLSGAGDYVRLSTQAFRVVKSTTPGPYTFVVPAARSIPRRVQHPNRRTIGLRIPDAAIPRDIAGALGEPLMTSTLLLPGEDLPCVDPESAKERLAHLVDLIIDGGPGDFEPTTVVELTDGVRVLREGKGDPSRFR